MPRYDYKCESCGDVYQLVHSIKEKATDCDKCNAKDSLTRLPSFLTIKVKKEVSEDGKVGELVKKHIEEAKQEVKEYKKSMIPEEEFVCKNGGLPDYRCFPTKL